MDRIWAPWRIEYIKAPKDKRCFICDLLRAKRENDRKNLVLFRGKNAVVILNKYPYISGHLMVAPNKHTSEFDEISEETVREMWQLLKKSLRVLKEAIKPEGFNIGMNLGAVAGAGLKTHIHIHIVPRWAGDTNFMPVLGDIRVIAQALDETYEVLEKCKGIFDEGKKINNGKA